MVNERVKDKELMVQKVEWGYLSRPNLIEKALYVSICDLKSIICGLFVTKYGTFIRPSNKLEPNDERLTDSYSRTNTIWCHRSLLNFSGKIFNAVLILSTLYSRITFKASDKNGHHRRSSTYNSELLSMNFGWMTHKSTHSLTFIGY